MLSKYRAWAILSTNCLKRLGAVFENVPFFVHLLKASKNMCFNNLFLVDLFQEFDLTELLSLLISFYIHM
jgi:hypothetical protein